jgi:serine/threonine protein kinase
MIDSRGFVKLIDFGFCKYLIDEYTYTLCGTPGYLAPEVVAQTGHNHGADHWALGILVFEMLYGFSPFYYDGVEQNELFLSIMDDPVTVPDTSGKVAKDFVTRLLDKNPKTRLGVNNEAEIINHKWFKDLDSEALRNKSVKPPWQPAVTGLLDATNFNPDASEIHDLDGKPVSERDAKLFEGLF